MNETQNSLNVSNPVETSSAASAPVSVAPPSPTAGNFAPTTPEAGRATGSAFASFLLPSASPETPEAQKAAVETATPSATPALPGEAAQTPPSPVAETVTTPGDVAAPSALSASSASSDPAVRAAMEELTTLRQQIESLSGYMPLVQTLQQAGYRSYAEYEAAQAQQAREAEAEAQAIAADETAAAALRTRMEELGYDDAAIETAVQREKDIRRRERLADKVLSSIERKEQQLQHEAQQRQVLATLDTVLSAAPVLRDYGKLSDQDLGIGEMMLQELALRGATADELKSVAPFLAERFEAARAADRKKIEADVVARLSQNPAVPVQGTGGAAPVSAVPNTQNYRATGSNFSEWLTNPRA